MEKGISHRVVPDSIIHANFFKRANYNFKKKILISDWQGQVEDDIYSTIIDYYQYSEKCVYFPLFDIAKIQNENWRYSVENLKTSSLVLSARHHLNYLAGLSGIPFIPFPSNSYKIEGTIRLSNLNIPICFNSQELEKCISYAYKNKNLFLEFKTFLNESRSKSHFKKLFEDFNLSQKQDDEFLEKNIISIKKKLKADILKNYYDFSINQESSRLEKNKKLSLESYNKKDNLVDIRYLKFAKKLKKNNDYFGSIELLKKHLKIYPYDSSALMHYGLSLLHLGKLNGLRYLNHKNYIDSDVPYLIKRLKLKTLSRLKNNQNFIIWSEKSLGIGTEFFLIGFLGHFNLKKVILMCDTRLHNILNTAYPEIKLLKYNGHIDLKKYGVSNHTNILSLLYFAYSANYFNEIYFANYQKLFDKIKISNQKYISVGLSWKTNEISKNKNRSIPDKFIKKFSGLPSCKFYNLQHGIDLEVNNSFFKFFSTDLDIDTNNIENLLNIISKMDLIITIDNSNAFFANSLSKPTILMTTSDNWLLNIIEKFNFNKSLFKIIQKQPQEDWNEYIDSILKYVENFISKKNY